MRFKAARLTNPVLSQQQKRIRLQPIAINWKQDDLFLVRLNAVSNFFRCPCSADTAPCEPRSRSRGSYRHDEIEYHFGSSRATVSSSLKRQSRENEIGTDPVAPQRGDIEITPRRDAKKKSTQTLLGPKLRCADKCVGGFDTRLCLNSAWARVNGTAHGKLRRKSTCSTPRLG